MTNDHKSSMSEPGNHKLTIDEWREAIHRETKGEVGRFRFFGREVFSSRAYIALSLIEREILKCYINKLRYESPDSKTKRTGRTGARVPVNSNDLTVTNNEIKARRIVGEQNNRSITAARKRLFEIGFLDVVKPGQWPHAGVFAFSDRWRRFPNGDYLPKTEVPVSFPAYANIDANHNRKRRAEKPND